MAIRLLFFPFTHISGNKLDTVLTFFKSFEYLPMTQNFELHPKLHKLLGQGKVTPFFLSDDQAVTIDQNLEQYLSWASIHKGNEVNLKSLLKNTPYFTDDSDVTAIKSQLKKGKGEKENLEFALHDESALMQDLLFLKMAKLYDEQNEGIDLVLNDMDISHGKLISNLRGLESFPDEAEERKPLEGKDVGAVMTRQRICAWSRCMARMGGLNPEGDTPLFMTSSDAVFNYLESNCKDVVNALDIDRIKVHENGCGNKSEWQDQFFDYLTRAVQGVVSRENQLPEVNDNCSFSGQIKLCVFSGNDICKLFNYSGKQIFVCLIKLK
ncbi:MAG: hypothetical protein HOG03_05845 [Desulfobacula sp.]|jgi:hypothetical protein|uniref:hypothetical protein n=1 Tax=Desulfobacula sp. TaxID=2593537 RepID=UPI001D4E07D4|nr:hypothetical protein [Desulfobacula sp.]MBT3485148.1 hypothetical protein [Desulfobacula sp.]MBT3804107.1 hypothetical protein [Desulfobacula sp.]MBT4025352.1 hypothetical protein [Desulfobacula sp.]MBT4199496.1 hypothetical protein [Desulfobacula sp.]